MLSVYIHCFQIKSANYLMEWDLGHLSDVVLSLVTLQDLDLDGVGEACKRVNLINSSWNSHKFGNWQHCSS